MWGHLISCFSQNSQAHHEQIVKCSLQARNHITTWVIWFNQFPANQNWQIQSKLGGRCNASKKDQTLIFILFATVTPKVFYIHINTNNGCNIKLYALIHKKKIAPYYNRWNASWQSEHQASHVSKSFLQLSQSNLWYPISLIARALGMTMKWFQEQFPHLQSHELLFAQNLWLWNYIMQWMQQIDMRLHNFNIHPIKFQFGLAYYLPKTSGCKSI